MAAAVSRSLGSSWLLLDFGSSNAEAACFNSRPSLPTREASVSQAFDSAVFALLDKGDGLVTPLTWREDCGVPLITLSDDSTRLIAADVRRSLVVLRAAGVAFCAAGVAGKGVLGSCCVLDGSSLIAFLRFDSGSELSSSAGRGLLDGCGVGSAGAGSFSGGSTRITCGCGFICRYRHKFLRILLGILSLTMRDGGAESLSSSSCGESRVLSSGMFGGCLRDFSVTGGSGEGRHLEACLCREDWYGFASKEAIMLGGRVGDIRRGGKRDCFGGFCFGEGRDCCGCCERSRWWICSGDSMRGRLAESRDFSGCEDVDSEGILVW